MTDGNLIVLQTFLASLNIPLPLTIHGIDLLILGRCGVPEQGHPAFQRIRTSLRRIWNEAEFLGGYVEEIEAAITKENKRRERAAKRPAKTNPQFRKNK